MLQGQSRWQQPCGTASLTLLLSAQLVLLQHLPCLAHGDALQAQVALMRRESQTKFSWNKPCIGFGKYVGPFLVGKDSIQNTIWACHHQCIQEPLCKYFGYVAFNNLCRLSKGGHWYTDAAYISGHRYWLRDCTGTGPKGERGDRGFIGFGGSDGSRGVKGQRGWIGHHGPPGITGQRGNPGQPGPPGFQGPMGNVGARGHPGPSGKRIRGTRGSAGFVGAIGESGVLGDLGETGPPGPRGRKGRLGATGMAGEQGDPGEEGARGERGYRGSPGEPGEPGSNGAQFAKVDCEWARWADWQACTSACAGVGGQQRRERHLAVQPIGGGKDCVGRDFQLRACEGAFKCPGMEAANTGDEAAAVLEAANTSDEAAVLEQPSAASLASDGTKPSGQPAATDAAERSGSAGGAPCRLRPALLLLLLPLALARVRA